MKKIGLLVLLAAVSAGAQDAAQSAADSNAPQGTAPTSASFPVERIQTPTYADMYCAGFINKSLLPDANYVEGGLQTPNTTKFVTGDIIYLAGGGYTTGGQYTILRELKDQNRYEVFPGQAKALAATGQPYGEIGRVRIVDTRNKTAIAQIEYSCDPINPGDIAVPFTEKPAVSFHPPLRFDRFVPKTGKTSARIVLAKDFDSTLGTGMKVYMNLGANQGVKVGDYFRAVRSYSSDLADPVDSLSFRASTAEDTQRRPPSIEGNWMTKTKGPNIHVADLPRRAVGEIVVLSTTPTTATGMIVFALEDVHVGDGVELDDQQ
ncbi:MAG: hypothetical protein WA628_01380 [Terriglobales bacterium]